MGTTGAPYNIPYLELSTLLRDIPAADEAQAEAVADALDAAGGLVAVKSALLQGPFSANVATQASVNVTGLSITHALADASNKLLIMGSVYISQATGSDSVGLAVHDGTNLLAVGDASQTRLRTFGMNAMCIDFGNRLSHTVSFSFVHSPASTSSITYNVRVLNGSSTTKLLRVNRMAGDANQARMPAAASSLIIQEVRA